MLSKRSLYVGVGGISWCDRSFFRYSALAKKFCELKTLYKLR